LPDHTKENYNRVDADVNKRICVGVVCIDIVINARINICIDICINTRTDIITNTRKDIPAKAKHHKS
jgi:hypothetical protein